MVQTSIFTLVILIWCSYVASICNGQEQHDIYQCPEPSLAKTLLCQKDIKDNGRFLTVQSEIIDCPETGINQKKISCVIVTNLLGLDGGYANIISGGLSDYKVQIALKSQLGKGLDYHIEVFTIV